MANKIFGGRWQIIEKIGEGGQGRVFRVRDLNDGHNEYVLKLLKNVDRIDRFRTEIETIEKLEHPNIAKLIDSNLIDARPYLVSEYCSGGDLSAHFHKLSLVRPLELLSLFSTICKAIGYAHDSGTIHRDIKPANVLLKADEMSPVVTDFGICFNTQDGFERLTETNEQVGARYFMAPELADGRTGSIYPSCDVYSLGKLLYWMINDRVFDREKFKQYDWDLRKKPEYADSIHFIYEIFDKTIVENPSDRFENGNQLAKSVDKIIAILQKDGRFLDANIPSKCIFCGNGKYAVFAIPTSNYGNVKLSDFFHQFQNKSEKAFCLVCENCGNIQFFSLLNAKQNSWKI
jgi:serine/threonine protein kinase